MTKYPKGIFGICWRLVLDGKMSKHDEEKFKTVERWFVNNLPVPEPCKNQEKVITFFKTSATEMLKKAEPMMYLLEKYNHQYDVTAAPVQHIHLQQAQYFTDQGQDYQREL